MTGPHPGERTPASPRTTAVAGHPPAPDPATLADTEFEGRTVVVTGATRGIGAATALLFGALRARVVVHGRDAADGAAVCRQVEERGGEAVWVAADLRRADAAEEVVAAAGDRVDVLVNNAGANAFHGVLDTTAQEWADCLDLDLRAPWLLARACAAVMPRGSAIVTVASNHATATLPGVFPYNVAKAGVLSLTRSLAIELAPRGIRASTVSPGFIDTPINEAYFATFPDAAAERARVEALHPLGRLGTPDEVARAIRFLASGRDSGFTTGVELVLDGGRSTLLQDPDPAEQVVA